MFILKELQKASKLSTTLAVATVVAVLSFAPTAQAAGPFNNDTAAGNCTGSAGTNDCGTAVGHIGVSVVGTLSINELQAINFGNVAVTAFGAGDAHVILSPAGTIGAVTGNNSDGLILLSGANANGGTGVGATLLPGNGTETGTVGNGGQHAGIYEIKGAGEGGQTRVYISFADTSNNPLDCNGDTFYPANKVTVTGPAAADTFLVNAFTFTGIGLGSDVYGHYITAADATAIQVPVGATLSTDPAATAYGVGKYVGEFNITASY